MSYGRPRLYPDNATRQRAYRQRLAAERHTQPPKVYHRSTSTDWGTPPEIFAPYDQEFGFTLDVCASPWNAKCPRYFTITDNGLLQDWGREVCWCNPPYGVQITRWMEKAYLSSLAGATVVCLVPSRTDTRWWHTWVLGTGGQVEVRWRAGRDRFMRPDGRVARDPAAFPLAVVIYRPFLVGQPRPH